jgi:hypothetical protein
MPRLRVRPSLETCFSFMQNKCALHHLLSAPSGHATKRAAHGQRILSARYSAAALLFSAEKVGDAAIASQGLLSDRSDKHSRACTPKQRAPLASLPPRTRTIRMQHKTTAHTHTPSDTRPTHSRQNSATLRRHAQARRRFSSPLIFSRAQADLSEAWARFGRERHSLKIWLTSSVRCVRAFVFADSF